MSELSSGSARVFLSSTFRDFGEERDLLVRRVFPALRARLRERFVELVDVDLRWGITAEAAERGEVLPICLAEIDRSRPWFVGMLGDRYGWVPPASSFAPALVEQQPWLAAHQGGKSVTELEILHGVLNDPAMAGRAFFYFRDPAYAQAKGGDYVSASAEDAVRLQALKAQIRASGFPVVEDYPTPAALAERLEADLWAALDKAFPADEVPDAFERERRQHDAYAAPRRRLYLGGERYLAALGAALAEGAPRILVEGQSGGGKSALLANWLAGCGHAHPEDHIHSHYLGATASATDPAALVRHLIEHIKRVTGSPDAIPAEPQAMYDSLPTWFGYASAHAGMHGYRWLVALDALNNLSALRDLRWLPAFLPQRVHLVVSCLPGEVRTALADKGPWHSIVVEPLRAAESTSLLRTFLGQYNKTLAAHLEARILAHPLAVNALFLRTLAEELRLFGNHEALGDRLDDYLGSLTIDDLFERVLERVEQDCGSLPVRTALVAMWASRAGLTEEEVLAYAGLVPATWAPIRLALNNALMESNGRITYAHDYLRIAVSDRYLAGNNQLDDAGQSEEALALRREAHAALGQWFEAQVFRADATGADDAEGVATIDDARAAEELPYQWWRAGDWPRLEACLTDRRMFEAFLEYRSNEELLGYWLVLEGQANSRLEESLSSAWDSWALDPDSAATGGLANAVSGFLEFAGRHAHPCALALAQLAVDIAEQAQGPGHPSTGIRLNNLGSLLQDMGDYAGAVPLFRRALAIAEQAQGPEHPDTGTFLNNLGLLLRAMGDYAGAEPLYRRALAIAEQAQGPGHPDTGIRLNNLGSLLQDMGDYAGAEPLYRRALDIAEQAQGPGHPSTGIYLSNLGQLLQAMGDYAGAVPLFRRALAIAEQAQGPEHPDTGTFLNNLGLLLRAMGDYAGAVPLFRRALAIAEQAQGPEHPDTGTFLNNLGQLLQAMGDYAGAEPLLRRALAIAEQAQGPGHPSTGIYLSNLGQLLQAMGDYAGAEPLYRRALAIAEQAQGPEHPDTGTFLNNLGLLLRAMGDYAGAEPLYRRALAIAEQAQGPEHPDTGTFLNNLGLLLRAMGDYAGAVPLFRRALAIAEQAQGPEHPDTGTFLNNLGQLLQAMGDYAGAEPLLRRALAIAEQAQGPGHPSTGIYLSNLGQLLQAMGDYAGAEPLYRRALDIAEQAQGPGHPSTGISLGNLGSLLQDMGDYAGAVPLFRRALAIAEQAQGPEHPDTGTFLNNLGQLLQAMGDYAGAEPLLRRALAIAEQAQGPGHPSTGACLNNLGLLLQDMADYAGAEPILRRALGLAEKLGADDPDEHLSAVLNLVELLKLKGDLAAAGTELEKAVQLADKIPIGGPFYQLAELRVAEGKLPEAASLFARCLEIRQQRLQPGDQAILDAQARLAEVQSELDERR